MQNLFNVWQGGRRVILVLALVYLVVYSIEGGTSPNAANLKEVQVSALKSMALDFVQMGVFAIGLIALVRRAGSSVKAISVTQIVICGLKASFTFIFAALTVGLLLSVVAPNQQSIDSLATDPSDSLWVIAGAICVILFCSAASINALARHVYHSQVRLAAKRAKRSVKEFPGYQSDFLVPVRAMASVFKEPTVVVTVVVMMTLNVAGIYFNREGVMLASVAASTMASLLLLVGCAAHVRAYAERMTMSVPVTPEQEVANA